MPRRMSGKEGKKNMTSDNDDDKQSVQKSAQYTVNK